MTIDILNRARKIQQEIERIEKVVNSGAPTFYVGGYGCRMGDLYHVEYDSSCYYGIKRVLEKRLDELKSELDKL